MRHYIRLALGLAVALVCTSVADAAAITFPITLYNTGVVGPNNPNGTNSTQITVGGTPDSHYTVAAPDPQGNGPGVYVVTDQSAYSANNGSSSFVNDVGSGQATEAVGDYLYSTTFNLPAIANLSSVTISGEFAVDNEVDNILLNGKSIGGIYPAATAGSGPGGFQSFTTFTIPAGAGENFLTGTNTLTFDVYNAGTSANPTAVNISLLSGTYATPEPSSIVGLVGLCGMGLAAVVWRRRKAA